VEQRKQSRGSHQHFLGFRARLNCEAIPVIPAWLVRNSIDDPRRIPHLLLWKSEWDGKIKEAVRLARYVDPHDPQASRYYVELKRPDWGSTVLRVVWRTLPRNGGRALLLECPCCKLPRRFAYGWEWDSSSGWSNRARRISWLCRSCAGLRYSSEGGYLRPSIRFRAFGNLPRPEFWLPRVFTSLDAASAFLAATRSHQ
jgi:hypothetical protein